MTLSNIQREALAYYEARAQSPTLEDELWEAACAEGAGTTESQHLLLLLGQSVAARILRGELER